MAGSAPSARTLVRQVAAQFFAQDGADQRADPFDGLDRHVAGEAVGNDHIGGAGGDVLALDHADEVEVGGLEQGERLADQLVPFDFFLAIAQQADARDGRCPAPARHRARPSAPTARRKTARASGVAPTSAITTGPRRAGKHRAQAGPVDALNAADDKQRRRDDRAGVPRRDQPVHPPIAQQIPSPPPARSCAAAARPSRGCARPLE